MIAKNYIEYFLADHCNLRCAHCSHFSPHLQAATADLQDFEKDLAALAKVMRVERFRFLGGEPLLNRSLPAFIDRLRESDFAREIGLCTNGLLLHKTDPTVWTNLDSLDVSLYPESTTDPGLIASRAQDIARRFGLQVHIDYRPDFRVQNPGRPIADKPLIQSIFDACKIGGGGFDEAHDGCHTFYRGRYFKCSRPVYTGQYLQTLGLASEEIPDFATLDGVPLHKPDLEERLRDHLLSTKSLVSCNWCLGTSGVRQPHRMLDRQEALRPVPSEQQASALIDPGQMEEDSLLVNRARARLQSLLTGSVG